MKVSMTALRHARRMADCWREIFGASPKDLSYDHYRRISICNLPFERKELLREWAAELELKAEGLSNRVIAQVVGVHESTVREDLNAGNPAHDTKDNAENGHIINVRAGNPAPSEPTCDPETGEVLEDDSDSEPVPMEAAVKLGKHGGPRKAKGAEEQGYSDITLKRGTSGKRRERRSKLVTSPAWASSTPPPTPPLAWTSANRAGARRARESSLRCWRWLTPDCSALAG
jgi:hypothetical protein